MKALDFLQGIVEIEENKYHGGRVVEFSSEDFKDIQEAIAELEALESRSCEGCKYGKFGVDSLGYEIECRVVWTCARGHKDKWEAKQ